MATEQRQPSMREVAAAAGVSASTVSRVLAGRGELPTATRLHVQAVARELGYTRESRQRGRPATTGSRLIELVLSGFGGDWTAEVMAGAQQAAERNGFDLALTVERDDPADDWPTRIAARRSAGVVLGIISPTRAQLRPLQALQIPLVLLDPRSAPPSELSSVGTDNWQGGYDAGAHLAARGHEHFLVAVGVPQYRYGREREEGFRAAVAERLPHAQVTTVGGAWSGAEVDGALVEALAALGPGTGVFCWNDSTAFGVYRAAARAGLDIPRDLSVVGFDDHQDAASMRPPLTTVHQPIRAMAAEAVGLVVQLRQDTARAVRRIEIPSRLIVRGSTG